MAAMLDKLEQAVELEDAIRFNDLLSTGAGFQINREKIAETIDDEIFDDVGSDDDDGEDIESKMSPWKKSFDELKLLMEPVPNEFGTIHKRIITAGLSDEKMGTGNTRFTWSYQMFFESAITSFDACTRPMTSEKKDILMGLRLAAETMCLKEEAQFIIDYKLMYGDMGCPPRIKPKADVLLVAKLVSFSEVGDEKACDDLSDEDRRKFSVVMDKVEEMFKKALDHFANKRYRYAINVAQSAVRTLELCNVADEAEQELQQKMVAEMYTHLSDCYIATEEWKRCCSMINELRRLINVNKKWQILLNEGIALSNIEDDYVRSIKLLRSAQKLAPHNEKVNATLNSVLAKEEKYKREKKAMWQKAFEIKAKSQSDDK